VFPQEPIDGRLCQTRLDPSGQGILVILLDLGDQLPGMDGHERLELGAVDFAALETGG
jgi:hypothetical protein